MPSIKLRPPVQFWNVKNTSFLLAKSYQYIYLLELTCLFSIQDSFGSKQRKSKNFRKVNTTFCIIFCFLPKQLCSGLHALGKCGVGTTVQCCTAKSKAVEGLGTL